MFVLHDTGLVVRSLSPVQLCVAPWTSSGMLGSPVLHYLPEFAQIRVHRVGDAIRPSHPLSSPSPFLSNQSLFQWVGSSNQVADVLELKPESVGIQDWFPLGLVWYGPFLCHKHITCKHLTDHVGLCKKELGNWKGSGSPTTSLYRRDIILNGIQGIFSESHKKNNNAATRTWVSWISAPCMYIHGVYLILSKNACIW